MKLSPHHLLTIGTFARQVPLWTMPPGEAAEARARAWSTQLAEQLAFDYPTDGWGKKRADPGRPVSKDAIARQVDGGLWGYDVLTGAGTGAPALVIDPGPIDLTGQVFVPVTATNHLRTVPTPITPITPITETPPAPAADDLAGLIKLLNYHHQEQMSVLNEILLEVQLQNGADANNERRYQDLVAHLKRLPTVFDGDVRILGHIHLTGSTPKPKDEPPKVD